MIDNVVKAGCEAIGVDLHGRKLRAQGGQALAEALPEMLETGAFEMRHCSGHGGATEPERHRCCPQIEQRQHHLQHGLKAGAVVGELKLRRYLAVLQRHRRGGVGTQPETVPGTSDRYAGRFRGNEVKGGLGRPLCFRRERGDNVTLGVPGARDPRLFCAQRHAAPLRRARDPGLQKWLRDPGSLKARVDRCRPPAMSCSVRATAAPGRAAAMVAAAATCMR